MEFWLTFRRDQDYACSQKGSSNRFILGMSFLSLCEEKGAILKGLSVQSTDIRLLVYYTYTFRLINITAI